MSVWHDSICIPKGQSSKASKVICKSHVWHDSFTLYWMSHMWHEYVTWLHIHPESPILESLACDMTNSYWIETMYIPKAQSSKASNVMYRTHVHEKRSIYIPKAQLAFVFVWLYISHPESPILQSLKSHVHESRMTWLIHIIPNESYVTRVPDMWHDSIYIPKSRMSYAWVMRDMTPFLRNRPSHPSNDMCVMTQYKSRKPNPGKSRKSHLSVQTSFPPHLRIYMWCGNPMCACWSDHQPPSPFTTRHPSVTFRTHHMQQKNHEPANSLSHHGPLFFLNTAIFKSSHYSTY